VFDGHGMVVHFVIKLLWQLNAQNYCYISTLYSMKFYLFIIIIIIIFGSGHTDDEGLPDGSCFRRALLSSDPVEDHYPCPGRPISCEGVKVGTLRPASAPNTVPSIAARSAEVGDNLRG
jgi:hypothetical protein